VYEEAEVEIEIDIDIAAVIDIFPSDCIEWVTCAKADLTKPADSYDFYANYAWVCEQWIDENQILWTFKHTITGKTETRRWIYVDNYDFLEDGLRSIKLEVVDKCGKEWSAQSYLQIWDPWDNGTTSLWIEVDALNILNGGTINFTWLSSDPDADDFVWSFWDGSTWYGETTSHEFNGVWAYVVELQSWWNTAYVTINVYEEEEADKDTDGDWVYDNDDMCVYVPWVPENRWCPIVPWDGDNDGTDDDDDRCPNVAWPPLNWWCPVNGDTWNPNIVSLCGWVHGDCESGYICSVYHWWPWEWICLIDDVCSLAIDGWSFGNVSCNSCPCNYSVNFDSELKICDIVFPAITSRDGKRIYSKWEIHQILR